VNAPRNFEADLMRRINSESFKEKKNFWTNLFLPSRLIPSAALAVSAVVLFFLMNTNTEVEDPLLIQPKIREDFINPEKALVIYFPQNYNNQRQRSINETSGLVGFENDQSLNENRNDLYLNNGYFINKNGLNFRQVDLTPEEQQRLNKVRERFKKLIQEAGNR
ncbi:MAG TPA: hypothetical protein VLN45_14055, partial [Ignavibacteriaceae bacterium]|nr:hypothetical protein [Ignavibacteriaceae bacterium]